jgi:hypothetical protein
VAAKAKRAHRVDEKKEGRNKELKERKMKRKRKRKKKRNVNGKRICGLWS